MTPPPPPPPDNFHAEQPLSAVASSVLFSVACVIALSNLFLLLLIQGDERLRRRCINLLISLSSLCDLLFCVRVITLDTFVCPCPFTAPLTTYIYLVLTDMSVFTSSLLLFLLLLLRFRALSHPLSSRLSLTSLCYMSCIIFLTCCCLTTGHLLLVHGSYHTPSPSQHTALTALWWYDVSLVVFIFLLPLIIETVLVVNVVIILRRKLHYSGTPDDHVSVSNVRHKRAGANMMLCLYLSQLMLCAPLWFNVLITHILVALDVEVDQDSSIPYLLNMTYFLNGFTNIIIYTLQCRDIRRATADLFTRLGKIICCGV